MAKKIDVDRVVASFLSSPLSQMYRHVNQSWFVYDDGFWFVDLGNVRIGRAIQTLCSQEKITTDPKIYMIQHMRQALTPELHYDRLPGRLEQVPMPPWAQELLGD